MKTIAKILSWIVIIFSFPFLLTAIIDFFDTKDFIDIIIFLVFSIPFWFSCKYLLKNKNNKRIQSLQKNEKLELPIDRNDDAPHSTCFSTNKTTFPNDISEQLPSLQADRVEQVQDTTKKNLATNDIVFPDWYVSISFGKSTSDNYMKAVALAKSAPQYHEQFDNGKILHQAIYSENPKEYLSFIALYELVGNWKSSFVIINGKFIDRKIIGQLNYCYGDRCRSGNINFCYGASYMTDNPFGCHRLQISACNNPWWSFYHRVGNKWVLDKESMLQRINSYSAIYSICPMFNYNKIITTLNSLPSSLNDKQYHKLIQEK